MEKVNANITGIAILRPDRIEEIKYLVEKKMLMKLRTDD